MVNVDWVKQPHGITKIVILLLSVTSVALWFKYGWYYGSIDAGYLTVLVIPSNLFVIFYFILAKIIDDVSGKMSTTIIVFDIAHAILNIAVAGCGIDSTRHGTDGQYAGLAFVVLTALAMLVDAFLEYKKRN